MKTLKAAISAGADAVYFGAHRFSARAFAGNFEGDELTRAIEYAAGMGVKTYLAINTLITDREMEAALEIATQAHRAGATAFIVQDLGLAANIMHRLPDAVLHASTQMTATTAEDVNALKNFGFRRVVLARELSRNEIREIAKSTDAELEIFVHGALCSSYSGQCLMSSFIGGRSANRGKCAAPCRLPYRRRARAKRGVGTGDACHGRHMLSKPDALLSLKDARAKRGVGTGDACYVRHMLSKPDALLSLKDARAKRGVGTGDACYGRHMLSKPDTKPDTLLSLKDLCLIDHVGELSEMGVAALKIEGRMKGEDYVSAVVSAYRAVLDGANLSETQRAKMLNVFNRGGYTDGYFTGSGAEFTEGLKNPYGNGREKKPGKKREKKRGKERENVD
ncbi:MAG: U32 family peptidase [Defluviitaleaceae bacterium]|nr:U32 family peptidase [Defluviitaleaceae bacterium]